MAMYSELKAVFEFDDKSTLSYTMSPYSPLSSAVSGFKSRVMSANENKDFDTDAFTSGKNSFCTGIKEAEIYTVERTVLFAKSSAARLNALRGDFNDDKN